MNYGEALAWLYGTQTFGIKPGLENIERLLRALQLHQVIHSAGAALAAAEASPTCASGFPPAQVQASAPRVIHVAGTNGKGSVCAFADAICRSAGLRTGLFTSPHLVSFRERIRANGQLIGEQEVARGLTTICRLIADWDPHPTFFEIVTALAAQYFQAEVCDVIVLETGMGGRLDATNALRADVAVLTPIALDHQKWLGHSVAQIAGEKAGIIKPGMRVVSAPQPRGAETVIRARATDCKTPVTFVGHAWTESPVALPGEHQQQNAAVAVAALRASGIVLGEEAIRNGLAQVEWPARFQAWGDRIIVDGAHNPAGTATVVGTWREHFGNDRATIVLAILRDKNAAEMIKALRPIASGFIFPQVRSVRAMPPPQLARLLSLSGSAVPRWICGSVAEALAMAEEKPGRILVTGSLHFAGEALACLGNKQAAFEECIQ